jgi:hypothetical protein
LEYDPPQNDPNWKFPYYTQPTVQARFWLLSLAAVQLYNSALAAVCVCETSDRLY